MKNFLKGYVKTVKGSGRFSVLASTATIDRQGESIDQAGWELLNYMANPVMLWAHNYGDLPVGKAEKIEVDARGLVAEGVFASAEANPLAAQIQKLYEEGILNTVSVGFIPKERNGNIITKAELLEISFVPVPANPEALALVRTMKGFEAVADMLEKNADEFGDETIVPEKDDEPTAEQLASAELENELPPEEEKAYSRKAVENTLVAAKNFVAALEDMLVQTGAPLGASGEAEKTQMVIIERSALEGLRDLVRTSDRANERALSTIKSTLG